MTRPRRARTPHPTPAEHPTPVEHPVSDWKEPAYKRPYDLTILVVAHLLLLPVWLVLWTVIPLLIYLDDGGPIFYHSDRVGQDGRVFRILKFRTMVVGADQASLPFTIQDDPRVTRVGRILRRTALDELPQLLSIFKGDMSFVGPRPYSSRYHRLQASRVPGWSRRLRIRPGLTCLAAVCCDGDSPDRTRLAYDRLYARHMSLSTDLRLMFMSLWVSLLGKWDKNKATSESADSRHHAPAGAVAAVTPATLARAPSEWSDDHLERGTGQP